MYRNYIEILGIQISWYSILGFAGLMAAWMLCRSRCGRFGIEKADVTNMMAYSIVGIIVGSKLLALICMAPDIIAEAGNIKWNMDMVTLLMQSGFVFYGGLLGVIASFYIYCRQFGLSCRNVLELAAPGIPLFHVFGRIGCFSAGCCYGIGGFPLQLLEAGINICIFLLVFLLQQKGKMKGKTFLIYLITYSSVRFVLEFLRGDPERGFIGMFSVSQWISVILLVVSAVFLFERQIKR